MARSIKLIWKILSNVCLYLYITYSHTLLHEPCQHSFVHFQISFWILCYTVTKNRISGRWRHVCWLWCGEGGRGRMFIIAIFDLSTKHIVTNIINDITYYINYHISVYNRNMTTFQFRSNILLNLSVARLAAAKRPWGGGREGGGDIITINA